MKQELKLSDVDQMDILVGLTETFATNPEAALLSSNIIGFLANWMEAQLFLVLLKLLTTADY